MSKVYKEKLYQQHTVDTARRKKACSLCITFKGHRDTHLPA